MLAFANIALVVNPVVVVQGPLLHHAFGRTARYPAWLLHEVSLWYQVIVVKFLVLLLPVAALALGDGMLADIVRLMEQETSRILEQDYIRAVRARNVGLGRHLFRGIVGPAVSIMAGKISYLISGSIVVEFVFGWRGLAFQTLSAVSKTGSKDYPLILAMTMLFVGIVLLLNLFSDLTALFADPRLRRN